MPSGYRDVIKDGKKLCIKCNETKPIDEFYWFELRSRISSECKKCTIIRADAHARANRDKRAVAHKKRLAARPDHVKEHKLKWRYGLKKGEYERMFEAQDCACAICGTPEGSLQPNGKMYRFHVDHCHKTNRIRGILCFKCNTAIGSLRDDPELVRAAAKYLEHHQ